MIEALFIGTLVPLLFLSLILRHSRPVLLTFCAGIAAFEISHLVSPFIRNLAGWDNDVFKSAVIISPILEELLKSIPLYFFLFFGKKSFRPFLYIFGVAAGIGFSIQENLAYLLTYAASGRAVLALMILRSLSTSLMHGASTGFTAYIMTQTARHMPWGLLFLPAGYAGAIVFHGAFNWMSFSGFQDVAILLPLPVYVIGGFMIKKGSEKSPELRNSGWRKNPDFVGKDKERL